MTRAERKKQRMSFNRVFVRRAFEGCSSRVTELDTMTFFPLPSMSDEQMRSSIRQIIVDRMEFMAHPQRYLVIDGKQVER